MDRGKAASKVVERSIGGLHVGCTPGTLALRRLRREEQSMGEEVKPGHCEELERAQSASQGVEMWVKSLPWPHH